MLLDSRVVDPAHFRIRGALKTTADDPFWQPEGPLRQLGGSTKATQGSTKAAVVSITSPAKDSASDADHKTATELRRKGPERR